MTLVVNETLDEYGKPFITIKSPKYKASFIIYKSHDGFGHFKIRLDKGKVPKELDSAYTGIKLAMSSVVSFIEKSSNSKTVRTEAYYEENH